MIKITVTPPNQPSFSQEFSTVSDAYDFLETLRVYGYETVRHSAQSDDGESEAIQSVAMHDFIEFEKKD